MRYAIKTFEIRAGSTDAQWYNIEVYFRGHLIENFCRPKMSEAIRDFEQAGYEGVDFEDKV